MMQREHVGAPKKRFSQDKLWLMFMISRTRLSQNTMISSVNSRPEIMNSFCFMMGGKDGSHIILSPLSIHFTNLSFVENAQCISCKQHN